VQGIPEGMVSEVHNAVARADVALLQRIDEGYREGLGLGTDTLARIAGNALVVRWPSLYWADYVRDLFYLRDSSGQPVTDGPLTPRPCGLGRLRSRSRCGEYLSSARRPGTSFGCSCLGGKSDRRDRDQGTGLRHQRRVAHRIRVQGETLFFTMNHPTNRVLSYVAQQIVDSIALLDVSIRAAWLARSLGRPSTLHANHVRALGLTFWPESGAGFGSGA
jgi:hypothetical protein